MIGAQVGRVVGSAIDWSVIRVFGLVGVLAERRWPAQVFDRAGALAAAEESRDSWEPDELWVPDGPSAFVWPESVGPKHGLTCRSCEGDIATCGCWDDDEPESDPVRSAAVTVPAADNTTDDPTLHTWHCAECSKAMHTVIAEVSDHKPGHFCSSRCAAKGKSPEMDLVFDILEDAAAQTNDAAHLEAAWNYHKGAVGYAAMRAGGVEWFCEGCSWSGATKQAHARHRFQVLADMKNATTRITQQMGGTA